MWQPAIGTGNPLTSNHVATHWQPATMWQPAIATSNSLATSNHLATHWQQATMWQPTGKQQLYGNQQLRLQRATIKFCQPTGNQHNVATH